MYCTCLLGLQQARGCLWTLSRKMHISDSERAWFPSCRPLMLYTACRCSCPDPEDERLRERKGTKAVESYLHLFWAFLRNTESVLVLRTRLPPRRTGAFNIWGRTMVLQTQCFTEVIFLRTSVASGYKREELKYSVPLHEGKRTDNRFFHSNWVSFAYANYCKKRQGGK